MSTRFSLKDFGPIIRLNSVTEWLRRTGWSVKADGKGGLLCEGPLDDDGNPITRILPQYESYGDYELRLEDLIATLAIIEERPASEIIREMACTTVPVEEEPTYAPPTVEELIAIVEGSIGSGLPEEQLRAIVPELTPILGSAELAASQTIVSDAFATQEAALVAVRLAKHLPRVEGAKLVLWRMCSRLLGNKLALTPAELDEFYAMSVADSSDAPHETLVWLEKHLAKQEEVESGFGEA
jgi:hypothetical protein